MASNLGNDSEDDVLRKITNQDSPSINVNDAEIETHKTGNAGECDEPKKDCEDEARRLRRLMRFYFYAAFKWKGNACSFHVIHCWVFLMQIIKVALLTTQMFHFGNERGNFSSVVNRGHLTLRHILLKNWDASWETLPYPPAQGDFAVYTIGDLEKGINYAVKNYYNAENEAKWYNVRTQDDKMTATVKFLDFQGFHDARVETGLTVSVEVKRLLELGHFVKKIGIG